MLPIIRDSDDSALGAPSEHSIHPLPLLLNVPQILNNRVRSKFGKFEVGNLSLIDTL
jgi:hypothetical protein